MRIAVEGCAHGELQKIYETIQGIEKAEEIKVDLLLCCGDFQSTRNLEDLQTMAVPKKYQDICTFYKYYSGELVAPILTLFIGGNHEASNYLQELPYGGWVAPNIYYLGYAGVVQVNGVRIAGVSGIYKGHDYLRGRHEFAPYTDSSCRSVYHVRQLEVYRLKQLSGKLDICMSHDWPRGITSHGNQQQLLRFKPHFRDDVENDKLGSPPCEQLLHELKPTYWFAAHLHCKFAALITHEDAAEDDKNDAAEEAAQKVTKFLALDKCLPKRRFLQVLEIEAPEHMDDGRVRLEYDLEWLTILQLTNHLTNVKNQNYYLPRKDGGPGNPNGERYNFTPSEEELDKVRQLFGGNLVIPENFCRTVEAFQPDANAERFPAQPKAQINPQSTQFCDALGIDDPLSLAMLIGGHELSHSIILDVSDSTFNDSSSLCLADQSSLLMDSSSCLEDTSPLKRKSSLGLALPSPSNACKEAKMENSSHNRDELLLEEDELQNCDKNAAPMSCETATNIGEEELAVPAQSTVKKFRRRNQELYKAASDDEEQQK